MKIDFSSDTAYWVNREYFITRPPNGIYRASLSDSRADEFIVPGDFCDIALDPAGGHIYWTACAGDTIYRARLDGSEPEEVLTSQNPVGFLTIDREGRQIYWSEPSAGKIRRANLDGTGVETLVSGALAPTSIALDFGQSVEVSTEEASSSLPSGVSITSVYPNPARASTTVEFALDAAAEVQLEVYDVLGRLVEVLASGVHPPGTTQIEWEAGEQASGVYVVRLTSEQATETALVVVQR